jgi:hypothetical protein
MRFFRLWFESPLLAEHEATIAFMVGRNHSGKGASRLEAGFVEIQSHVLLLRQMTPALKRGACGRTPPQLRIPARGVRLWLRCLIPQGQLTGFPVATQSCRMTSVLSAIFLAPARSACRV